MRLVTHLDWAGYHEELACTGDGVLMIVVHKRRQGREGVLRPKQLKPSSPGATLGVNAEVFDSPLVLHRESKLTNTVLTLSDEETVNRHILQSGLGDTPRKLAMKPPVVMETQMGGQRIWVKGVVTVSGQQITPSHLTPPCFPPPPYLPPPCLPPSLSPPLPVSPPPYLPPSLSPPLLVSPPVWLTFGS